MRYKDREISTQEKIAKAMYDLVCNQSYSQITIAQIVETVPVSRRTFYNYFSDKDAVIYYIVASQFLDEAFPASKMHLGQKGLRAFFSYIWDRQAFYLSVARYDNGDLLRHALILAYGRAMDYIEEYARPIPNEEKRINPMIYRVYTHSALASVIVYWLTDGLRISVDDVSRDTAIMMEHAHSYVRDHYLL